ncbi:MAG TPA: radical SAM protein [Candidatus Thermoplasmatota archaeon]|nr:radical SAM protein [Candidatus Thermoplasmatota archaeon]
MEGLPAFVAHVEQSLRQGTVRVKEDLQRAKQEAAKASGVRDLPTDPDLGRLLPPDLRERFAPMLRGKPMRSQSGVAVVAVMSSAAACPHGKCSFCPGGPEVDAPQSYTGFEPSTMRARRHGYDPYAIVRGRLAQLAANGHAIGKVDLVVQGGTFPARPMAYQDWFVAGLYAALNDGPAAAAETLDPPHSAATAALWGSETAWASLDSAGRDRRLQALQRANEEASCRAIGLTIETKPDWCLEPHLDAMLRHGATRVEIGLQCLDDEVLRATHRGHTLADSRHAMQAARDAGFKVCVHMMPGLPRPQPREAVGPEAEGRRDMGTSLPGLPRLSERRSLLVSRATEPTEATASGGVSPAEPPSVDSAPSVAARGHASIPLPPRGASLLDPDPVADVDDMRVLFEDPAYRPDMLKVYPTLVVMEGETLLKAQWRRGEYHPYGTAAAAAVVAAGKSFVPEWCRIQRIDRDIPTTHLEAGVMNSNLRQLVQQLRATRGLPPCRCIRCREAGTRAREGVEVRANRLALRRSQYEASGGTEAFLALEDPAADAVVAFLRLRHAGPATGRAEGRVPGGAAFVRELKVYGLSKAVGDDDPEEGTFQHKGHGAALLREAERVAFGEWGVGRLLVIAGPGVKPYYRRHGYTDMGPYVGKDRPR